ncbi:MAG TPA: hypothetical protein VGG74_19990 [Kofleriaceae bacterium]|jgi:hypothetical protein
MRTSLYALALVLVVGACGRKKTSDDKSSSSAADKPAAAATLSCAKLMPAAITDKYLAGFQLKESDRSFDHTHQCHYQQNGNLVSVDVNCNQADKRDSEPETMKKAMNATDVAGVGKTALLIKTSVTTQYDVWDDDTPCHILVTAGSVPSDPLAFTKDVVGSISPSTIQ